METHQSGWRDPDFAHRRFLPGTCVIDGANLESYPLRYHSILRAALGDAIIRPFVRNTSKKFSFAAWNQGILSLMSYRSPGPPMSGKELCNPQLLLLNRLSRCNSDLQWRKRKYYPWVKKTFFSQCALLLGTASPDAPPSPIRRHSSHDSHNVHMHMIKHTPGYLSPRKIFHFLPWRGSGWPENTVQQPRRGLRKTSTWAASGKWQPCWWFLFPHKSNLQVSFFLLLLSFWSSHWRW